MTILIVGGGKMGLSHLAIASRIAGSTNVAVCDANRMTRLLYNRLNIKTYASIKNALSGGLDIKGAVIATPTTAHFPIARTLIEAKIPCFIEKPLTLSSARSQELVDLAATRMVYTQVGFVLRYVSTFSRLRDLVRSSLLGKVLNYEAQMRGNVITKPDNESWRTNFSAGGGCLNEYGPHIIDLCRFIFGDVEFIRDAHKDHVYSTRADDKIEFNWTHASGVSGDVKLDWCDPAMRKSVIRFEINFEYARVTGDNSALSIVFRDSCTLTLDQQLKISAVPIPPKVSFYLRGEEYTLQLEDFIGHCLNNNYRVDNEFGLTNGARLQDGFAVDKLIESIAKEAGLQ